MTWPAWIGVLGVAELAAAGTLPRPLAVRIMCTSGREVSGEVAAWDVAGVQGSFGRIEWAEIPVGEVWHLCAQTIDPDVAGDWMSLGRVMAGMQGGRARAEQAFRWAGWLDPDCDGEIASILSPLDARAGPAEGSTAPPARCLGPSRPQVWTELSADERARAVEVLKSEGAAVLRAIGVEYALLESPFFLLYTDLPRPEAQVWLERLDVIYVSLVRSFRLPEDRNLFWGKCVVFMSQRREGFVELERVAFGHPVPETMEGLTHTMGPREIANFWRMPDERKLGATLAHETTHAFLHRYRSDAQLPLWLDEGFADFAAQWLVADSPIDEHRRPKGVAFARTGGPVDNILDMECIHDAWPGPDYYGQGVSYLLVDLLFKADPAAFVRWIDAIKDGSEWEAGLVDVYGMTRAQLVEGFTWGYGRRP
jgi:hypothetical protein